MAEEFGFFDPMEIAPDVWDREYNADEFTVYFGDLVTTGVMKGKDAELKVTANGSNMITEIDTGVAYIEGRRYSNTAKLAHTHDTETLGKNRIDRIVVRMDLNERWVKSFVKKGIPSASPVAPVLTQTANLYEISLAQVKVVGGQTYVNVADIVDERGKEVICPWAGSKILPNFNDVALEGLINKVDNMHALTEGPDAIEHPTNDFNNLLESGFYNMAWNSLNPPTTVGDTATFPTIVIRSKTGGSTLGVVVTQLAFNTATAAWFSRYILVGVGAIGWRPVAPPLNNSLTSTSTSEAATANAVKLVNDKHILGGNDSPEGQIVAPVGTLYTRSGGGTATTTLFVKTAGQGNTGWTAK